MPPLPRALPRRASLLGPNRILTLALGAAMALGTLLAPPARAGALKAGDKAPSFSLKTVDSGEPRSLESFTKGDGDGKAKGKSKRGKGAVVVFLSCKCPYVVQARAPLAELAKKYGDEVAFVGVNANQNEKLDEIKGDAAASFPFPMLRDEGSKVADLYAAERTPEAFVVDGAGVVRYHGGVADLGPALAELVAGKPISKPESKAFGCTIKRKP